MESNGKEGHVQVSYTTKAWLDRYCPGRFKYEKFSEVENKFFDKVTGYVIHEANQSDNSSEE
jgi:hypothetical protein